MAGMNVPPDDDSVMTDDDGGSTFELPDETAEGDVIDTPDGGAMVMMADEAGGDEPSDFYANIAEELDENELRVLATELEELVKVDKQAREDRDKQYADGIRRTGFTDDAPSGADFEGASKVQHPMIGKAAIDFASHAMKELFPADGPVKDKIVGDITAEKVSRAKRKTAHMNWQLTEEIPEFRPGLEQLLSQVPIGGAQYMKVYYDALTRRPATEIIWIDDMLLPSGAASFLSARRRTVRMHISRSHYIDKTDSGEWLDVDSLETGMVPDETEAEKANAKIEGKSEDPYNKDGIRIVYEIYVWREIESDSLKPGGVRYAPYIVTLDENTNRICAVYRNWDVDRAEKSGRVHELQHVVEWPFIPWRGAYPIGLYQLIGQLAVAATGSLRALLDSALINNTPVALKLKGMLRGGQIQRIDPTQINELEGTVNNDDIRKLAMPIPFNQPSSVLLQLLGMLSDQGADMVRTAMEETAQNADAPVGTTMARIEQGMIVFSAIHSRLHSSMAQVLKILHRINGETLEDEVLKEDTGETLALRQDYEGPMDVVPVSDPNIFSEAQRFAQTQAIAQRGTGNPLYDQNKLEQRILDTLKIPNPDELLVTPPNPEAQDPVTENVGLALGKPAVAFPNQDHVAHLGTHLQFATDPNLGANDLVGPGLFQGMIQHLKEHLVFLYAKQMGDTVGRAAGKDIQKLQGEDPQTQNALARAFLAASRYVASDETGNVIASASKQMGQVLEMAKKFMQENQPQDPNQVMAQAAAEDVKRKTQADQVTAQEKAAKSKREDQKLAADTQLTQTDQQLALADLRQREAETQSEQERAAIDKQSAEQQVGIDAANVKLSAAELAQKKELDLAKLAVQERMNKADNMMAFRIAIMEMANQQNAKADVTNGGGLSNNPQPGR